MNYCPFCRIARGETQTGLLFADHQVVAFHDINPQAPTHVLIIPRRHISTINDLETGDAELVGKLYLVAREIAASEGLTDAGYRVVTNCNEGAGQSVFHIHMHLLGGRPFAWPPG